MIRRLKRKSSGPDSSLMRVSFQTVQSKPLPFGSSFRLHDLLPSFFMLLFHWALTLLLLPHLNLPSKPGLMLLASLLALLLASLITRYRRASLIGLSLVAFFILMAFLFPDGFLVSTYSPPLLDLTEKGSSWWTNFLAGKLDPELDLKAISALLVFLSGLFFFLLRLLSRAPLTMLLLASIAYGLQESLLAETASPWAKYLYLAALLATLYQMAQREQAAPGFKRPARTNHLSRSGPKVTALGNWSLLIALLVVFSVAIFDLLLPDDFFKIQRVEKVVSHIVERGHGKGSRVTSYLEFSLQSLGYQPLDTRLGGRAIPDTGPYLTIETDGYPVWLKGSSRRQYTGNGWLSEGMNPSWLFNDEKAIEPQRLYIGVRHQSEETGMLRTARNVRLNIFPRKEQQALFHGGRPAFYRPISSRPSFNAYFNRVGTIYLDQTVPEQGYTLLGQSILPLYLENEEAILNFIQGYETQVADRLVLSDQERKAYLELPELAGLEERVLAFDPDLHRLLYRRNNAMTDPVVIEGIVSSLSTKLTYSLEAGIPDESREFVGWFLEEGRGYCTFFATAVTVMARQAGLPARYVEGFLVPATAPGRLSRQTITGERAHAWTEVWFDGVGWIPVDATPADYLKDMVRTDYMTGLPPQETSPPSQVPSSQESQSPTSPKTSPPTSKPVRASTAWKELPGLLRFFIFSSPLWVYLFWRYLVFFWRHDEESQKKRMKRLGQALFLEEISRDIFSLWALDGKARMTHETLRAYVKRVQEARYESFPPQLYLWLEAILYGPPDSTLSLDDKDLRRLLDFYRQEEVYLRKTMGFWAWFLRRWLISYRIKRL